MEQINPRFAVKLAAFLIVILSAPLMAQTVDPTNSQLANPEAVMEVGIAEVLAKLKRHEALFESDPQQLRELIAESAVPYFNTPRMAQLVLAKHWRSASAEQRETFVHEFQRYLIRSYTNTLYEYRDNKPEMLGNIRAQDKSKDKATLKINVKDYRGQSTVLFMLLEVHDGNWGIVDINVEGVSLVITARSAFDGEITQSSLDSFLDNLTEQNTMAATNAQP